MYIVVNSDLNMGKGKIAAQVGHGVAAVVRFMERTASGVDYQTYKKWTDGSEAKIVLKAPEEVLLRLAKKYTRSVSTFCIPILDAGRTQIPKGSLTVVAFLPVVEKNVPDELKPLKLL